MKQIPVNKVDKSKQTTLNKFVLYVMGLECMRRF